ncbi:hypothetical protein GCM10023219_18220 [Stakelama sediminis]|uniref:DUF3429 domain-containing protein n=2 Tax=Stakelama sediminis TaxID=463200 RepID=A0A840Z268_9SPHN|nr:hypothetical protein [Stakelama sediminis]
MIPFVAAAVGIWLMHRPWPMIALWLVTLWGALILSFIAGVRRGFGFGRQTASTRTEILTMLPYFVIAGLALVVSSQLLAIALLMLGFLLAAVLDRHAALNGDAPAHFARLRPPQFLIAVLALAAIWLHLALAGS